MVTSPFFFPSISKPVLCLQVSLLIALGSLAGIGTYAVARRCRRSNRRTAQTMTINSATADIASAARLCLGFERIKLECRA